jgi:hypothetical protein
MFGWLATILLMCTVVWLHMQELRKEKDELGRHFWNVTEQHKLLNDEHQQLKGQLQAIDQQMQANHQRALLAEEVSIIQELAIEQVGFFLSLCPSSCSERK